MLAADGGSPDAPTSPSNEARSLFRSFPLCEATCGIAVHVAGNRATGVTGDGDDPLSRGFLCPKAHGLIGLHFRDASAEAAAGVPPAESRPRA